MFSICLTLVRVVRTSTSITGICIPLGHKSSTTGTHVTYEIFSRPLSCLEQNVTVIDRDLLLSFWGQNKVWEQETKSEEGGNTNALLDGLVERRAQYCTSKSAGCKSFTYRCFFCLAMVLKPSWVRSGFWFSHEDHLVMIKRHWTCGLHLKGSYTARPGNSQKCHSISQASLC